MPKAEGTIVKKQLPIVYVIDTSGSMSGERIASVNDAMRDAIKVMKEAAVDSPEVDIKIGVLQFATGATWITNNGLVSLEHFYWNDLSAAGTTNFGAALKELNDKFSKNAFLKSEIGYAVPIIICMSDGYPDIGWEKYFEAAKENAWFRGAIKVCIGIGDDADMDMLSRFAGDSKERIVRTDDLNALKAFLKAVSATASMMGQSKPVNENGELIDNNSVVAGAIEKMGDAGDALELIDHTPYADDGSDDPGTDTITDVPIDDIWA